MIVLAKEFHGGSYANVQDRFMEHWTSVGGIQDMMMIAERITPARSMIYVLLPKNDAATFYDGFEIVSEEKLPREASLLVGYQPDFEKRFKFDTRP